MVKVMQQLELESESKESLVSNKKKEYKNKPAQQSEVCAIDGKMEIRGKREKKRERRRGLCNVGQFIVVQALDVILLHEGFDVLLDIGDFGWEAGFDLLDNFLDELDVFHLLT